MKWLRSQRQEYKGGRRKSLKKEDRQRVWTLMKQTENNKTMVADLLGVSRRTVIRFLKDNSMPKSFTIDETMNLKDFSEIQVWLHRIEGFANKNSIGGYLSALRKFYEFMKQYHSDRAKPSLWTSDDANEFIYGNEKTEWKGMPKGSWHFYIVPIRSLALKAQVEFPQIDLGLLPTKRTHRAKRSLAGKKEYYYTPEEVDAMIINATTLKAKAIIAFLYNTACRTTALTETELEDLHLNQHRVLIKDKGSIWWDCWGLTDKTCYLLSEYLKEREAEAGLRLRKTGWLFANNGNGKETKMTTDDVNQIIKKAGQKAGIKDKVLTAKAFRKSFVENYFTIEVDGNPADPMILAGTGKGTQGQPKTAFCVGWSLKVLVEHYAPKMKKQIEKHRQRFAF